MDDKNNTPQIINSKAFTYAILTLCILVSAKFLINFGKDAGIFPLNKRDNK
jgi:hypothetical protein